MRNYVIFAYKNAFYKVKEEFFMASKRSRLIALVLSVMTLISVMAVGAISTSAATGDTVYCENAANWSTVYCYMWGDSGKNAEWPGIQMTKGSDGLWAYTPTDNWNNIIFNAGSGGAQTDDLTIDGNCFNNSTNSWSTIQGGDTPVTPTPTPTTPVTPTPSGDGKVYLKDTNNWGNIHVYMWNSEQDKNASWPGEKATSLGDGVYEYTVTKAYANIIFNNGSDAAKTGDLIYPGEGQIYDNGTGTWSLYDTSKLHIKSFTGDVESPQFTGVKIKLTAVAGGGEGALSYQFSVGSTVISEYSSNNSVVWTPTSVGNFTVKVDVKDTQGQTISKSLSYEIKDIKAEVTPVIQSVDVTPTNFSGNELLKGKEATVNVTAGGGNTGTKLLFYKYTITDSTGATVNVPYYSLSKQYKFTPAATGNYSLTSTVQASDNSFTTRTVEYKAVDKFTEPGDLAANVSAKDAGSGKYTISAEAYGGTAPYTYKFDVNGKVVQDFSATNTYTLTATAPGVYNVTVTVKDGAGKTTTATTAVQIADNSNDNPNPTDPKPEALALTVTTDELGGGQYKFTATATGGAGSYQYEFVANGYTAQAYAANNAVTLSMAEDGAYVIKVSAKDANGTVVSKEFTITVQGGNVDIPTDPVEPSTPLSADVSFTKNGDKVTFTATATGGSGSYEYQFTVNGVNIQDFSTKNTCVSELPKNEFGAIYDGVYSVSVSVRDSSGSVVIIPTSFEINNGAIDTPTKPTDPVDPSDYLKGDADLSGKVNIKDASQIQKHVAKILELTAQGIKNADTDGNGSINIKDATQIQKYLANIISW